MSTSFCSTRSRRAPADGDSESAEADSDAAPDADQWNDDGDSWWSPHPVPPSYRDET
jgi:hypothetical protein